MKSKSQYQDKKLLSVLRKEESLFNDPVLIKIIESLEDRLTFHRNMLISSKKRNCALYYSLSWLIPIISALMTSIVVMQTNGYSYIPQIIGVILTILTITNSVFHPSEKYIKSSYMLVRLHDWEMDLVIQLQAFSQDPGNNEIYKYLKEKDAELSKAGVEITDFLSPTVLDSGENHQPPATPGQTPKAA